MPEPQVSRRVIVDAAWLAAILQPRKPPSLEDELREITDESMRRLERRLAGVATHP